MEPNRAIWGGDGKAVQPHWCRASAGQRPPVLKVGNIEVILDFTDVKDVLKAYEQGADGRDIVEFLKLIGKRNWQIKIKLH